MKTHNVPLAPSATARGYAKRIGPAEKDAQVINGLFEVSTNPLLGTKSVYVTKRPGYTVGPSLGGDARIFKHYSSGFAVISAVGTTVYSDSTSIGTTAAALNANTNLVVCDAVIGGVYVLGFVDASGAGWFVYSNAISTNFPTFTGNRTSGSAIISGIASTTGIYTGQAISGTGIPASTRVLTVDSGTQITMTANATSGAGTATTITKEAIAKIIDADYPSGANSMEFLDGYFFVGTGASGRIYQSAINDPSSWAAADFISADYCGDGIRFIFKVQNYIAAAGVTTNVQYFYNNGNPSGSVLSAAEHLNVIGLCLTSRPVYVGQLAYCTASSWVTGSGADDNQFFCQLSGVNQYGRLLDDYWNGILNDNNMHYVGTAKIGNKYLVILCGTTATSNVVYDPATGVPSIFTFSAALFSSFNSMLSITGAREFVWSTTSVFTDYGAPYPCVIQTEPLDLADGNGATDNRIELLADNMTDALMDYGGYQFDGSTDYLDGNALTGIADGKKGTIVLVVRFANAASANERLMQSTGEAIQILRGSTGNIQVSAESSAGTVILNQELTGTPCASAGTYVIMLSWDLATSGSMRMYVNNATGTVTSTTFTDATIDYTVAEYSLGAEVGGSNMFTGDMYSVWFDPTSALDFSDATVRAKFASPAGVPQFLGARGERPTGSQPILFLGYNSYLTWPTNRGSSTATFTENGTPGTVGTALNGQAGTFLDVSDDDYGTWVSKGVFPITSKKKLDGLGFHDGPRAYRITNWSDEAFRAQMLRIRHTPSNT